MRLQGCVPNVLNSESDKSGKTINEGQVSKGTSYPAANRSATCLIGLRGTCNMMSYKIFLALIVTLAVPAFAQTSDVHAMQLAIDNLPTEFGSFEVRQRSP